MCGRWLDYEESGATPGSSSAAAQNTELLNAMLASLYAGVSWAVKASVRQAAELLRDILSGLLPSEDTLFVPNKTFWLAGGVLLQNARNVTLHLDGTLEFLPGMTGILGSSVGTSGATVTQASAIARGRWHNKP